MMKTKLIIAVLALVALSGCATRTGTAIVAGTAGMVIGNAMAHPRTVVVREAPVVTHEQVIIVNDTCTRYPTHNERSACERGARQRYYEEQRRRDNEAFRAGYGR
jgi:uncharacterized lipoprotein YajG